METFFDRANGEVVISMVETTRKRRYMYNILLARPLETIRKRVQARKKWWKLLHWLVVTIARYKQLRRITFCCVAIKPVFSEILFLSVGSVSLNNVVKWLMKLP